MPPAPTSASAGRVVDASVLSLVSRLTSPASPASLSEVLEHRIATAIAIGLLQSGDRFPSEEVMAQVLGVSGLTFRQALGRLRMRGLVRTRPGRGGGTVVSSSAEVLKDVADQSLSKASAAELADLGTAYASLFSQVARLAALRHDHFDDQRLQDGLRLLGEAEDPVQRRRAATLFDVTTASVARTETLMEFLVPVVGDLQSVLWLDGGEPFARQLLADLTALSAAIARSDPAQSERLAREHADRLTFHLVATRSRAYLQDNGTRAGLDDVLRRLDELRVALESVDETLRDLSPPKPVRAGSAPRIDVLLQDTVEHHADLVRGAGIAYAPGLLSDAPLWMDWWDTHETDQVEFKSHAFSNASLRYYDYRNMPWFTEPLRTGMFSAQGPYLDRGGIERVTVTVSLPMSAPEFQGSVLGADLHFGRIAEILHAGQGEGELDSVLLDKHDRVVVGGPAGLMPGDIAPSTEAETIEQIDLDRWPGLRDLGWRLVRLG